MINNWQSNPNPRILVWFSCGAASACAAKLACEKWGDKNLEILYCDTLKYEHSDNLRFFADVEKWIGRKVKILKSNKYQDIYDVFDKTGWLVGPGGARCTVELKKSVRHNYQNPDDVHVFGMTTDEVKRIGEFEGNNHELFLEWILRDAGISKSDCYHMLRTAGIELPAMYKLGYKNNNCIGCVKGQSGYWNKIRVDFPETFKKMAKQERKMNVAINKKYVKGQRIRLFLDELPPTMGRYNKEPDIECGPQCTFTL